MSGKRWLIEPGAKVDLSGIDTSSTAGIEGGKAEAAAAVEELRGRMAKLQERLYAEHKRSLLVVLQAMDTGGKDGTIRGVFSGINPQGVKVVSFKAPTVVELEHDFLWRVHSQVPAAGEIGIFNRSHYEDVGIVRVHNLVPKEVWKERFGLIQAFEEILLHRGTAIVKFFLHISKKEQAERLQARLDDSTKTWKFNPGDLDERAVWDGYQVAYQDAIARTSTKHAPWYVIPADHKWYRNWAVATVVTEALEKMDPQFPAPPDLKNIHIV